MRVPYFQDINALQLNKSRRRQYKGGAGAILPWTQVTFCFIIFFSSVRLFEFVRASVCLRQKPRERNNKACLLPIMRPFPCRITRVPSDGELRHQQRCIPTTD